MTILDFVKSATVEPNLVLADHISTDYPDSILSISQDAIKADIDRDRRAYDAALLRMVGVVNHAVYNAGKRFLDIPQNVLHSTAKKLFNDAVESVRNTFIDHHNPGIEDHYPVLSSDRFTV